tara:strand:+ start:247 stop:1542 length:1296 start_codon:yes stop_codon:yes gene_type:complete
MELVETFNTTLNDFIGNLKRCFPENTEKLSVITMIQDTRPLQQFMKCVVNNTDKISSKDPTLFDTPFVCISDLDLSIIIKSSENNNNTEAIWKFLQTLTLIGTTVRSKSANLEDFFQQFEDENFMNGNEGIQEQMMNMVQKLMEQTQDIDIEELDKSGSDTDSDTEKDTANDTQKQQEEYENMFKDTKIGTLAKEIAEDIDMSAFDMSDMQSPDVSAVMQKLVGGGGLKNLVKTVADKLKNKMESGDINQEELIGEVHEMMEKMQSDKKFKKMFKSKDVQGIFKEFMKQKGEEVNDDDDFSALEEMCGKELKKGKIPTNLPPPGMRGGRRGHGVRNRLRRKLEAKNRDKNSSINQTGLETRNAQSQVPQSVQEHVNTVKDKKSDILNDLEYKLQNKNFEIVPDNQVISDEDIFEVMARSGPDGKKNQSSHI